MGVFSGVPGFKPLAFTCQEYWGQQKIFASEQEVAITYGFIGVARLLGARVQATQKYAYDSNPPKSESVPVARA